MVIYLKYYRCRCLRWFKYKFMYHEKEKAATGLEPVTAKPFLPNPYLDYFDKLEVVTLISARTILLKLQFSQTTYTFLHLDYKCLYLSNPIQTGEAHLYL